MPKKPAQITLTFKIDKSFRIIDKILKNQLKIQGLFEKNLRTKAIDGNHAISTDIADLLRANGTLLENFLKATLKAV